VEPALRRIERYVAIGDSSTEGLDDPRPTGGFRGWADRLAESIAAAQGPLLYANLAIRGRRTRQILLEQLAPALGMRPDLATLFCGTNDVLARRFDAGALAADVEHMQRELVAQGAIVLSFTLPDLSAVIPSARWISHRVSALNQSLREAAARSGAVLVDFAAHEVTSDPRLWSEDRLHANAAGHARIAAALAHALGLHGADASWALPLPAAAQPRVQERLVAEVRWARRYLLPWVWRHLRGRSSGDGRSSKRPELLPF
jgi:lysophospholipase L1-like esterase